MKTQIEIDIDEYLSEDDKKEIAINVFKKSLTEGLLKKTDNKTNYQNYERVISNSVHHFLETEIDSILNCDHKEMILEGINETLRKQDYKYSLFRTKNAWEKEDSPAQKIANEAVQSHKEVMTKKIHKRLEECIDSIGIDNIYELFTDIFQEFLSDRLSSK